MIDLRDIEDSQLTLSGFDTCFTFLARGSYSLAKMNWILVKVFFGSGYLGFVRLHPLSMLVSSSGIDANAKGRTLQRRYGVETDRMIGSVPLTIYLRQISPVLGPPLMFIFVCMTNILLITSLISLMSNSLTKVRSVTCPVSHKRPEK